MTRLSDQRAKQGEPIAANPLPKVEGDSAETDVADENDTPPGHHPRAGVTNDGE